METVHKCASDPKTNREWLDSENPWQTLSSMIELSAAIKSGDPEKY
jgi:DNA-directed RNA polymerase